MYQLHHVDSALLRLQAPAPQAMPPPGVHGVYAPAGAPQPGSSGPYSGYAPPQPFMPASPQHYQTMNSKPPGFNSQPHGPTSQFPQVAQGGYQQHGNYPGHWQQPAPGDPSGQQVYMGYPQQAYVDAHQQSRAPQQRQPGSGQLQAPEKQGMDRKLL